MLQNLKVIVFKCSGLKDFEVLSVFYTEHENIEWQELSIYMGYFYFEFTQRRLFHV